MNVYTSEKQTQILNALTFQFNVIQSIISQWLGLNEQMETTRNQKSDGWNRRAEIKKEKNNIVVERKNEWRELIVLQFAMILIFLNIEISQQSIQQ